VALPRLHDRPRAGTMKTTLLKYALGSGFGGMLVLAAAGFGQVRTEPAVPSHMAQFCVRPLDDPDAHRFYCRNEDGGSGPTGAVAFACASTLLASARPFWSLPSDTDERS
jgi:hypothetical protein